MLFFACLAPYFLRADFSHPWRFFLFFCFLQAFSAFASFCARVSGLGAALVLIGSTPLAGTLPGPENVAVPPPENCGGDGAWPLHASPTHGAGGGENGGRQAELSDVPQTRASYTSKPVSVSCPTSFSDVRKNTSFPLALASRKADSRSSVAAPDEISETQPADCPQPSNPGGSYW